ncbi:hypothetical protein [Caulifigura coniformis]|uniref:hypothetical protein n=1 Tax=Caulifigura coniformis TaxID=2527983 RepID=UPI0011A43C94|nr:hypothetical protein [Caulifigura coniformis]
MVILSFSHFFFQHQRYSLEKLLQRSVHSPPAQISLDNLPVVTDFGPEMTPRHFAHESRVENRAELLHQVVLLGVKQLDVSDFQAPRFRYEGGCPADLALTFLIRNVIGDFVKSDSRDHRVPTLGRGVGGEVTSLNVTKNAPSDLLRISFMAY